MEKLTNEYFIGMFVNSFEITCTKITLIKIDNLNVYIHLKTDLTIKVWVLKKKLAWNYFNGMRNKILLLTNGSKQSWMH